MSCLSEDHLKFEKCIILFHDVRTQCVLCMYKRRRVCRNVAACKETSWCHHFWHTCAFTGCSRGVCWACMVHSICTSWHHTESFLVTIMVTITDSWHTEGLKGSWRPNGDLEEQQLDRPFEIRLQPLSSDCPRNSCHHQTGHVSEKRRKSLKFGGICQTAWARSMESTSPL